MLSVVLCRDASLTNQSRMGFRFLEYDSTFGGRPADTEERRKSTRQLSPVPVQRSATNPPPSSPEHEASIPTPTFICIRYRSLYSREVSSYVVLTISSGLESTIYGRQTTRSRTGHESSTNTPTVEAYIGWYHQEPWILRLFEPAPLKKNRVIPIMGYCTSSMV